MTTSTVEPSPARVRRASSHPTWAPVLFGVAVGVVFVVRAGWTSSGWHFALFDDAMVSMRFAQNLADGHGLVWNAGAPPVEGYTNFLWTLWLAVLHLTSLPGPVISTLAAATGVALYAATVVVVGRIATVIEPDRPRAASLARWLTALCYPLFFWSVRGMEVGLEAALIAVAVLTTLRLRAEVTGGRLLVLASATAALVLTRTDLVLPALTVAAFAIAGCPGRRWRVAGASVGTAFVTLGVHTLLRERWYGAAVPNTFALKLGGIPLGVRVGRGGAVTAILVFVELLVPVALALWSARSLDRRHRFAFAMLASVVVVALAYSLYVGGDAWEWMGYANRFVTPALPLLAVLAAFAVDGLARAPRDTRSRATVALGGLCLASAAAFTVLSTALSDIVDVGSQVAATGLAGLLLVLVGLRLRAPTAPPGGPERFCVAGLAAAIVLTVSGPGLAAWLTTGGAQVDNDVAMAVASERLRDVLPPDATVAVVWAGTLPYGVDRPMIDLLGKSDPTIAEQPPHDLAFYPGHMKWDYGYSIGAQRPAVVIGLWQATDADHEALRGWGYTEISPDIYVDPERVDPQQVAAALEPIRTMFPLHAR